MIKRVLAVGAHPDDIEFGCGGILTYMRSMRFEIVLLVMSGNRRRRREQKAACELGSWKVKFAKRPDTDIQCSNFNIQFIEKQLKGVTHVFTHYPEDTHQDHRNTSLATIAATRYIENVLYYEGPTTINFTPTVFFDISENNYDDKMKALAQHKSQIKKTNIADRTFLEMAKANAIARGIQARTQYAEGFIPLRVRAL